MDRAADGLHSATSEALAKLARPTSATEWLASVGPILRKQEAHAEAMDRAWKQYHSFLAQAAAFRDIRCKALTAEGKQFAAEQEEQFRAAAMAARRRYEELLAEGQ